MAAAKKKADPFFIRARVNGGNSNVQGITTIDLGAYVDALGQSVLRIHKIAVEVADVNGGTLTVSGNTSASLRMALTTAYPDANLTSPILSDNGTVSTGYLVAFNDQAATEIPSNVSSSRRWVSEQQIGPKKQGKKQYISSRSIYESTNRLSSRFSIDATGAAPATPCSQGCPPFSRPRCVSTTPTCVATRYGRYGHPLIS